MNPENPASEIEKPAVFTPVSPAEIAETGAPTETVIETETSPQNETASATAESASAAEKVQVSEDDSASPGPQNADADAAEAASATTETIGVASPEDTVVAVETMATLDENPALTLAFVPAPDAAFQSSLALSLFCVSENAEIFYSLGGNDLGETPIRFDPKEKILLTSSLSVAARARENGVWGPLLTGNFEIKKAIWQENEPADPADGVEHKISENFRSGDGWQTAAASVRGKLHAHRALWREDSFALAQTQQGENVWQIVAVSDGAGSAPLSRLGSQAACEASAAFLQSALTDLAPFSDDQNELQTRDLPALREVLVGAASAALDAIRTRAQERGKPLSAFAATLLLLVRRPWNGMQLCASLQVGDGAIALLDGENFTLLGEADHGQHSSETRFLTTGGIEAELPHRFKITLKSNLRAFLVVSDGVSDDYFPEEKRLGELFESVLPLAQNADDAGAELISWLGYEKKGSSDDRTLVVGWPVGSEEPAVNATSSDSTSSEVSDGDFNGDS